MYAAKRRPKALDNFDMSVRGNVSANVTENGLHKIQQENPTPRHDSINNATYLTFRFLNHFQKSFADEVIDAREIWTVEFARIWGRELWNATHLLRHRVVGLIDPKHLTKQIRTISSVSLCMSPLKILNNA